MWSSVVEAQTVRSKYSHWPRTAPLVTRALYQVICQQACVAHSYFWREFWDFSSSFTPWWGLNAYLVRALLLQQPRLEYPHGGSGARQSPQGWMAYSKIRVKASFSSLWTHQIWLPPFGNLSQSSGSGTQTSEQAQVWFPVCEGSIAASSYPCMQSLLKPRWAGRVVWCHCQVPDGSSLFALAQNSTWFWLHSETSP